MIADLKDQILGTLDPSIIYLCVAVLAITVIIAIVKKAITMALVVAIIGAVVFALAPMAKDYQENFYIRVNNDNVLEIMLDGQLYTLSGKRDTSEDDDWDEDAPKIDVITSLEMERQGSGEYRLKMTFEDGNMGVITIPGFMRQPVISFLDKANIAYRVIE